MACGRDAQRSRIGEIPHLRDGELEDLPDASALDNRLTLGSRLSKCCGRKEMVAQTGQDFHGWPPLVILKEWRDNALDSAEEAECATEIAVTVATDHYRQRGVNRLGLIVAVFVGAIDAALIAHRAPSVVQQPAPAAPSNQPLA
jgi:hypothetical protein